jgi:hypothetical protein
VCRMAGAEGSEPPVRSRGFEDSAPATPTHPHARGAVMPENAPQNLDAQAAEAVASAPEPSSLAGPAPTLTYGAGPAGGARTDDSACLALVV